MLLNIIITAVYYGCLVAILVAAPPALGIPLVVAALLTVYSLKKHTVKQAVVLAKEGDPQKYLSFPEFSGKRYTDVISFIPIEGKIVTGWVSKSGYIIICQSDAAPGQPIGVLNYRGKNIIVDGKAVLSGETITR